MSLDNLEDLFLHELKDVLSAEKQILSELPKMAKAADNEELRAAFEEHKSVTQKQVERLGTIFKSLNKAARAEHCDGMEGLLKEGSEMVKEQDTGPVLDAAMIGAAQKVEHYEIAAYGTLVTYARLLEMDDAVELLYETLTEEKEADEELTTLASKINLLAEEGAKK